MMLLSQTSLRQVFVSYLKEASVSLRLYVNDVEARRVVITKTHVYVNPNVQRSRGFYINFMISVTTFQRRNELGLLHFWYICFSQEIEDDSFLLIFFCWE